MKKILILTLLYLITSNFLFSQNIYLMTYNIRLDTQNDSLNSWQFRKDFLLAQLNYYKPDIFGIQEGLKHQVKWIDENLENYSFVGVGRADVKEKGDGEFSAIYYNVNKFVKIDANTFWLSETPELPSRGWDASLNRICTYILLKEKQTGISFFVFNTHFDHKGIIAREKSAELVLQKMFFINKQNHPMILMGDFNLTPNESPINMITKKLNDSRSATIEQPFGPEGTYSGFDICKPVRKRIDYIFTSKDILVNNYAVICDIVNQRYPSDHFPVLINIDLPN